MMTSLKPEAYSFVRSAPSTLTSRSAVLASGVVWPCFSASLPDMVSEAHHLVHLRRLQGKMQRRESSSKVGAKKKKNKNKNHQQNEEQETSRKLFQACPETLSETCRRLSDTDETARGSAMQRWLHASLPTHRVGQNKGATTTINATRV